jgi:hypothetical protein
MKFVPYWHDTALRFAGATQGPVEGHDDVAIIGAAALRGLALPCGSPRRVRGRSCWKRNERS